MNGVMSIIIPAFQQTTNRLGPDGQRPTTNSKQVKEKN